MALFDRFKKSTSDTDAPAPATSTETPAEPEEKQGLLSRFRRGLHKTSTLLKTDIRDLFKSEGRLVDEEFLTELYAGLVKTDMGADGSGKVRDEIHKDYRGRVVQMSDVLETVKESLRQLMAQERRSINMAESGPTVIMVVGVNGSGKTTSIAKLAYWFAQQGKRVVLGAGDTFRAAAVEQLTVWADRVGVDIVKDDKQGGDPASVAYRAVAHALKHDCEVCIIDTAGRLQTQVNLMQQLEKIRRVMSKQIEEAPHEVLLVLDATAGQNGLSQAKGFSDAAGCTGIVLAKLDGTAKGGVVIPIRQQFALPVKFIGLGESPQDLAEFDVDDFVEALFDTESS